MTPVLSDRNYIVTRVCSNYHVLPNVPDTSGCPSRTRAVSDHQTLRLHLPSLSRLRGTRDPVKTERGLLLRDTCPVPVRVLNQDLSCQDCRRVGPTRRSDSRRFARRSLPEYPDDLPPALSSTLYNELQGCTTGHLGKGKGVRDSNTLPRDG